MKSFKDYYDVLLVKEFDADINKMEGPIFFNHCKTYLLSKSRDLYDEAMYCEGLVRLVTGISWSLLISIASIILFNPTQYILLYTYIFILFIFVRKLRAIRCKEVSTIFWAYAFLKMESENQKTETRETL